MFLSMLTIVVFAEFCIHTNIKQHHQRDLRPTLSMNVFIVIVLLQPGVGLD